MFLKYFEDLWVAIAFAEAGAYNNALEEIMRTEEQGGNAQSSSRLQKPYKLRRVR